MSTRRNFLHRLSLPIMAMPFAESAINSNQNSALKSLSSAKFPSADGTVLRVALMGLGGYSNMVAKAIQSCSRVKITALISGTPAKLASWGEKYQVPESSRYNYQTVDQIKDNKEVDVVYITTPNALHKDNVIQVARAGKHVIVEKPMALNAKEGEEMVQFCKQAGVHLLVGYRMHFEPKTLDIVRKRQEGEFGKILFFQGLSGFVIGDPKQWRLNKALAGGGSMMDIGIYSVNGARYMIGEEPIWVTAQETKTDFEKFKEGVDETIQFQMGFPSGAVASCLSTYALNNLDRFFMDGTKGFAELKPATGYGPIMAKTNKGEVEYPHVTHQTVQMDEMAKFILDGKKPFIPVDGEEGLKDLRIVDAIYEAVRTGKKVKI
jgi:predicted dehydrogenase